MTKAEKAFRLRKKREIDLLKAQIAYLARENQELRNFARVTDNHRMMLVIQLLELGYTPRVYRAEKQPT